MSKQAKLPQLSQSTKLLSFDVETNGLHGSAFAVGGLVIDCKGRVHSEFTGRCPILEKIDPWVEVNVLPVINDIQITHASYKELREAFWQWYLQAEQQADYVLVSNGYPVEYRFLLQCQEDNQAERYWQHPFPILDLTSLLLGTGQNASTKSDFITRTMQAGNLSRHHPVHDAKLAALSAFHALGLD